MADGGYVTVYNSITLLLHYHLHLPSIPSFLPPFLPSSLPLFPSIPSILPHPSSF